MCMTTHFRFLLFAKLEFLLLLSTNMFTLLFVVLVWVPAKDIDQFRAPCAQPAQALRHLDIDTKVRLQFLFAAQRGAPRGQ